MILDYITLFKTFFLSLGTVIVFEKQGRGAAPLTPLLIFGGAVRPQTALLLF